DIRAVSGQFPVQRDAFTTPTPSPGLEFPTGFGPNGWLDWDPGPITGTIDSNGQIVLPHFGMRFWTDFSTPGTPGLAGNIDANFTTAIQARGVANRFFLFTGVPLNAQGSVRLVGTDFINYQIPLQTGTGLTCTLAPAPALNTLPKGATLASVKGVTKKGTDPNAADDSLTLTAVLVPGATAPVLDGSQDVLLRLEPASGKPVNILVPSGHGSGTAKKLTVQDSDG